MTMGIRPFDLRDDAFERDRFVSIEFRSERMVGVESYGGEKHAGEAKSAEYGFNHQSGPHAWRRITSYASRENRRSEAHRSDTLQDAYRRAPSRRQFPLRPPLPLLPFSATPRSDSSCPDRRE